MSFWPHWVYQMYDSYSLAQRAAGVVLFPEATLPLRVIQPRFIAAVEKALNQVDAPCTIGVVRVYRHPGDGRLRFSSVGTTAETLIAKRSDMVVMSSDGPLNAYVNPQGYVHEIITVYNATELALHGPPVKMHSWFPGYAWTIAHCAVCESNMGWLFTATKRNLLPKSFWGIRSSQVTTIHNEE